jgi:chromosome partitioning protein
MKIRPTKIIGLCNQAGGQGKTTITQNLGYQLSLRGHQVLLIDCDPQSTLTVFMGIAPEELEVEKTLYTSLVDEMPLPIIEGIHGVNLIPCNINLRIAEMSLIDADLRDFRLKQALEPVLCDYDFILIDILPSLGLLSYLCLVAATHLLVPVQTQYKGFESTHLLLNTVARVRQKANRQLQIAGFVPNIYASNNSQDNRCLAALIEQLSSWGKVFAPIPRSTSFADASEKHLPLALYNPKHPAVAILESLAVEMEKLS